MGYPIRTRDYHEGVLRDQPGKNRDDQNVEECGLSNWADGVTASYHSAALRVLETTERAESGVLVDSLATLVDTVRGWDVEAKMVDGQYGTVWLLSDAHAALYGRKFIPFGENSRVQRGLKLKQEQLPRPCEPYFIAQCPGAGCPVHLRTVRDIPESWGI